MRRRVVQSLGVAAVLAALVIFLQLSARGQGQSEGSAPAPAGPVPKTALGHPDLQGIWLDEFQTPLERPAQYANRNSSPTKNGSSRTTTAPATSAGTGASSAAASRTSPARTTPSSRPPSRRAAGRRSSSIRRMGGFRR
jgi:hypothetical protein